jgi:hypothetical protein
MVHLDQVVVDRLRDADAGEIVAGSAGGLGDPMAGVRRIVAADVEEVPGVELAERGQRPVQVRVSKSVAARSEDAGRRLAERIQEVRRLAPEVDVLL